MSIVLKPRMSEKTYAQSEKGVFVFDVDGSLNKHQIAEAVEKTYEVTVETVRVVVAKGKTKRLYRNRRYETGVRQDVKKAYVTLKKGDHIPIFAAIEQAEEEAEKADKKAKKSKKEEK
ncbi:50S ribosomal protein L23 [Candidatus Saccharibacteria bacterium]|nr:50S ribosomal protein L23 [Candidatus Saccharibacteria bacterium]MCA9328234.1 50S ribosomal protein L23 [Candidatus Saccharibacteria bacterium]